MSELSKSLLKKKFENELLQNAGSKQSIAKKAAIKLINGLQLEIINVVRFNDISLEAGLEGDQKDYLINKINYIRVLNACIVEYLFNYLELVQKYGNPVVNKDQKSEFKLPEVLERKILEKSTKMGLEEEIFWDARSDYETTPKKLSDIFIKTINFLEGQQLLHVKDFLKGLKQIEGTAFSSSTEPNKKIALKTITAVVEAFDNQTSLLDVITKNMITYKGIPKTELISSFSPNMSSIEEYSSELKSISADIQSLSDQESLFLQILALNNIIKFFNGKTPKEKKKQLVDTPLKTKLATLINLINTEKEQVQVFNISNNASSLKQLGNPEPKLSIIDTKQLDEQLKVLNKFTKYQELLGIISDLLTTSIYDINVYIDKIIDNVAQRGAIKFTKEEIEAIKGGARKRTKRKKQKNNKVSQRKNRIKVKKHASRKYRAKGKSKKGRKL